MIFDSFVGSRQRELVAPQQQDEQQLQPRQDVHAPGAISD